MKRKLIGTLIAAVLMALASAALIISCAPDVPNTETVEYSITVYSPDEKPLSDITVYWDANGEHKGSAVTNDTGKATVQLPAGTYGIVLDLPAGLEYTSVSVGSSIRDISITVSYVYVTYTASVLDKNGAPAENVTVLWMQGDELIGNAKTNANGNASADLVYGDYTVTVTDLPAGNVYRGDAKPATGTSPSVSFALDDGVTQEYVVTVKSAGGLIFKDFRVTIYNGSIPAATGWTDENGQYAVSLEPDNYTVRAATLQEGYSAKDATLTATVLNTELTLTSSVIMTPASASKKYLIGDIINDFTFTTPYEVNGSKITVSIAEALKTKKAVVINNWGTQCSNCLLEMPAMNEAYETYKDVVEIIAVSNYPSQAGYDDEQTIIDYYNRELYSFPMVRDDLTSVNFGYRFGLTGWPSTVVIDRYGAIARIEVGAVLDAEIWGRMFDKYIGDDYVQTFIPGTNASDSITSEVEKPDIVLDPDHYEQMADVLNNTDEFPEGASVRWFGEEEYEYAWPFVIGTIDDSHVNYDGPLVSAGGTGHPNSMSVLYAEVTVAAGKVFTFDYYAETEDGYDILTVMWDGRIMTTITGASHGWQTCRLYADLTAGTHYLTIVYAKDPARDDGLDNVFFKNVRFTDINDIEESTNMMRAAAYGVPEENAIAYPYYADVVLADDGYYHVDLSRLQNSDIAGNDPSPMLFVNLSGRTAWNSYYSINDLVYGINSESGQLIDFTFSVNGEEAKDHRDEIIKYLNTAVNSDISGYLPVDEELKQLLIAMTAHLSQLFSPDSSHDNEWLELCYFYSHYGEGEFVGNPIIGLTEKTAVTIDPSTAENGTVRTTAELTRVMAPFPITIYTFTPETSGVYRLHSFIPDEDAEQYASQVWLYDDETDNENPIGYCGDGYFTRDMEDEQNFDLYGYLTAGHKYYIAVAYLGAASGTFDFELTYVGEQTTILTPASSQFYYQVIDEYGNFTDAVELAGAVEYGIDDDGYYHVKNADGSLGGYLYLDARYPVMGGLHTLPELADMKVIDPADRRTELDYMMFDFTTRIIYFQYEEDGSTLTDYVPDFDMTQFNSDENNNKYRDYTADIKAIINKADENGLVKVDQEIVDILQMYFEMRNNSTYLVDNELQNEIVLDNEWLRFCWYYKTYDVNNHN